MLNICVKVQINIGILSMTETHLVIIGFYMLIGLFLADIFLVKVDTNYWLFLIFYPLIIVCFFVVLFYLYIAAKVYQAGERYL